MKHMVFLVMFLLIFCCHLNLPGAPDLQFHFQPMSTTGTPAVYLDTFDAFTASVCILRPESRGCVELQPDLSSFSYYGHPLLLCSGDLTWFLGILGPISVMPGFWGSVLLACKSDLYRYDLTWFNIKKMVCTGPLVKPNRGQVADLSELLVDTKGPAIGREKSGACKGGPLAGGFRVRRSKFLRHWNKTRSICPFLFFFVLLYSRMRSEGSRFTWGSGGEAVFAKFCVCVRNRSQPFATVCGTAVRLSTVASASGEVQKACHVDSVAPQLYWCLQRRCLCECSVLPQSYWRLQRRCLWEWSVSQQL